MEEERRRAEEEDQRAVPLAQPAAAPSADLKEKGPLQEVPGASHTGGGVVTAGLDGAQDNNPQLGGAHVTLAMISQKLTLQGYGGVAHNMPPQAIFPPQPNQQGGFPMVVTNPVAPHDVNQEGGVAAGPHAPLAPHGVDQRVDQTFNITHVDDLYRKNKYFELENYVLGFFPEGETFNITHVDDLYRKNKYFELENYVLGFFPEGETWMMHPWPILHIRRAWALAYIECGLFNEAERYFAENIVAPFEAVLQLDPRLVRNADLADLDDEINFIGSCVNERSSLYHPYTTDGMLPMLIADYFMLYLPATRFPDGSRKLASGLWQFGLELMREHKRPTFRCLVCTIHVFKWGTIGDIGPHLKDKCTGPKLTPYLLEKYQAEGLHISPLAERPILARRRFKIDPSIQLPNTASQSNVPQILPRQPSGQITTSRKRPHIEVTEDDTLGKLESIIQRFNNEVTRAEELTDTMGSMHIEMGSMHIKMKGTVQNFKMLFTEVQAAARTAYASRSQATKYATARERQLAAPNVQVGTSSTSQAAPNPSTVLDLSGQLAAPSVHVGTSSTSHAGPYETAYQSTVQDLSGQLPPANSESTNLGDATTLVNQPVAAAAFSVPVEAPSTSMYQQQAQAPRVNQPVSIAALSVPIEAPSTSMYQQQAQAPRVNQPVSTAALSVPIEAPSTSQPAPSGTAAYHPPIDPNLLHQLRAQEPQEWLDLDKYN